jgi:hypothetical protein
MEGWRDREGPGCCSGCCCELTESTEEKEDKRESRILGRRARFEFPRGRSVASGGLSDGCEDCEDCSGKGSGGCDSPDAPAFEPSVSMRSIEAGQTGFPKRWLG